MTNVDKKPSISKNIIYNTAYRILLIIVPLITAPYTARIFGADGIGVYSYTNSIVSYFTMFAALGTATYGQREIARNRDDKEKASRIFWEIEILSVITTSICLAIWLLLVVFSGEYSAYYLVLTLNIIAIAFDISWLYGGFEQFKYVFARNSIVRIVGVVILFTFVKKKSDLLLYIGLLAATGLVGNISMWTYLPQMVTKVNFRELRIGRHFKETLVYFIPTIATSVYNVADKTMLGLITHDEFENGYYEQAHKIINMAKAVLFSMNGVLSSRMAYLYKNASKEVFIEKLRFTMRANLFLAFPMMFGICGVSKTLVPTFFGNGFDKVGPLLCICSTLLVIIGMSNCLENQYYTPSGKRKQSNMFVISGAITNLIFNGLLIGKYGSYGASIASVAAEMIVTCLYMFYGRKVITVREVVRIGYKYLIGGMIMFFAVYAMGCYLESNYMVLLLEVIVGSVIYFMSLLIMKDQFTLLCVNKYVLSKLRKKGGK